MQERKKIIGQNRLNRKEITRKKNEHVQDTDQRQCQLRNEFSMSEKQK